MNTPKLQQLQNVHDDSHLYRLQPLLFYCITPPSSPAPQFYSFPPPPPPPPHFFYISQNFIMARFAAFERSKLHHILKTASISP